MEHLRLKPIEGASGREKTAFTMKTIKELLAEDGSKESKDLLLNASSPEGDVAQAGDVVSETPVPVAAEAAPVVAAPAVVAPVVEAAPVIEEEQVGAPIPKLVVSKAASLPPIPPAPEVAAAPVAKPRSFLGRLMGK